MNDQHRLLPAPRVNAFTVCRGKPCCGQPQFQFCLLKTEPLIGQLFPCRFTFMTGKISQQQCAAWSQHPPEFHKNGCRIGGMMQYHIGYQAANSSV